MSTHTHMQHTLAHTHLYTQAHFSTVTFYLHCPYSRHFVVIKLHVFW